LPLERGLFFGIVGALFKGDGELLGGVVFSELGFHLSEERVQGLGSFLRSEGFLLRFGLGCRP
jgi:hypothetical protein